MKAASVIRSVTRTEAPPPPVQRIVLHCAGCGLPADTLRLVHTPRGVADLCADCRRADFRGAQIARHIALFGFRPSAAQLDRFIACERAEGRLSRGGRP